MSTPAHPTADPLRHFLVFQRNPVGHASGTLIRAATPLEAIERFLVEEDQVILLPDGSVETEYGRRVLRYAHPLACVEALWKVIQEWQLREVPASSWEADYREIFCGEHPDEVKAVLDQARPLLRKAFPGSRARGFVWYLEAGALACFYRKTGHFQIEVLARFLVQWRRTPDVVPWTGDYNEILDQLWLKPPWIT